MKSLYIVATPIGNMLDITLRAINTLKDVDLILAENTLFSKKLLQFHNINNRIQSFHEHNEKQNTAKIIKLLETKNIALISDAGTPLINDPGYNLVSKAKKHNIPVVPIPGPSSIIASLSASGIATNEFCFYGFVPTKAKAKADFINKINLATNTSICFESPKRIVSTIEVMQEVFPEDRIICLSKELTKSFETIISAPSNKILEFLLSDTKHQNGEFVLIIEANKGSDHIQQQLNHILPILTKEVSKPQAAKIAAKITGMKKQDCYQQVLKL